MMTNNFIRTETLAYAGKVFLCCSNDVQVSRSCDSEYDHCFLSIIHKTIVITFKGEVKFWQFLVQYQIINSTFKCILLTKRNIAAVSRVLKYSFVKYI